MALQVMLSILLTGGGINLDRGSHPAKHAYFFRGAFFVFSLFLSLLVRWLWEPL